MYDYEHWKVGDDVLASFPKELHCYAECDCVESRESWTLPDGQEREGHRTWYVKVKLANGVITGEHEVSKEESEEGVPSKAINLDWLQRISGASARGEDGNLEASNEE